MGRLTVVTLVALMLGAGCLKVELTLCGDGRACPVGTQCDDVHRSCVSIAQTTACNDLVDGDRCDAAGRLGLCDRGLCISGCGDSVRDAGEECDDGDHESHDGCSSTCLVEAPSWTQWENPWRGRALHASAYNAQRKTLDVVGGVEDIAGLSAAHWSLRETPTGSKWTLEPGGAFPARESPMMAYDPVRGVTVLYGGNAQGRLNDTWELDATGWHQAFPPTAPTATYGATLVFDSQRGRLVLVGGLNVPAADAVWEYNAGTDTWTRIVTTGLPQDEQFAFAQTAYDPGRGLIVVFDPVGSTWEYDGATATWTKRTWTVAPDARRLGMAAYLPSRGAIVMFGGLFSNGLAAGDTWEYRATGWTQVLSSGPAARFQASLALDSDRGMVLLVGGLLKPGDATLVKDVWQYSSSGWYELEPGFAPSARASPLVYDASRRELVTTEGYGPNKPGDTWLFDGVSWSNVIAPLGTTSAIFRCAAYDAGRQRVVTIGGRAVATSDNLDTMFEWDGATRRWDAFTGVRPPPRSQCALAYDIDRRVLVLFGGAGPTDATWEFDGAAWLRVSTQAQPAALDPAMAYDALGKRTIVFDRTGVTWTYANQQWTPLSPATSPPPRQGATMIYNRRRDRITLYGGDDFDPRTWELAGDDWVTIETVVSPPPRWLAGFAPSADGSLVLFGGLATTSGLTLGDMWLLRYTSLSPDEVCANGLDDDADLRVDAADPDCI